VILHHYDMPDEKSSGSRLPKSVYKDSNGFIDPSRLQVTGQVLTAISRTDSANVQQREIRDQVEKRRFASHILESRGEYCPDLQTMKAAINTPATAASVKTRLLEEQKRHREEIADLYDWQVNEYLLGAEQNYYSKDDSVDAADVNVRRSCISFTAKYRRTLSSKHHICVNLLQAVWHTCD